MNIENSRKNDLNLPANSVRLVIFDMDGVLVDTEPLYVQINRKIYDELNVEITNEEYRSFVGIASEKKWGYVKQKGNLIHPVQDLINLSKQRKFDTLSNNQIPVIPGIHELLENLYHADVKLALASSNSRNIIKMVTERTGLHKYFHTLVSGEDINNGKPEPDIFLKAAEDLEIPPASCLVIEDSNNGIRAAKAAGMMCIGYKGPAPHPQDFSMADAVIEDYSEESRKFLLSLVGS